MQPLSRTTAQLLLLTVLAATFVAGCATNVNSGADKPAAFDLQKRAIERSTTRWKALTDKRYSDSFNFLSEASRLGTTASEYGASMQRMGFVAAVVEGATCDASSCTVRANVTLPIAVRNVGTRLQTLPGEERWILNNGELWLIRL